MRDLSWMDDIDIVPFLDGDMAIVHGVCGAYVFKTLGRGSIDDVICQYQADQQCKADLYSAKLQWEKCQRTGTISGGE